MTSLDVATLALSVVALNRFAARRPRHRRTARPSALWPWLLVVTALSLRIALGPSGLRGNLLVAARDIGVGLVAGWLWIKLASGHALAWLASGLIMLGVWFGVSRTDTAAAPVELLVELGPDDTIAELAPVLGRHEATSEKAFPRVTPEEDADLARFFLIRCPSAEATALLGELAADKDDVDSAETNDQVMLVPDIAGVAPSAAAGFTAVDDPHAAQQWGLLAIRGDAALTRLGRLRPRKIATIAIADTGVDAGHEDLRAIFADSPGATDGHGHGTHCAGIAGAVANNALGIASLNLDGRFVRVLGYPALGASGGGSEETVAAAIVDAAEAGADVISLSLGGYHPTPPLVEVDAVRFALKRGAIVVVAAGNDDEDAALHAPANIPGVIVVTAVDRAGRKATFSNTARTLTRPIAAPGVDIFSLGPGNAYVPMSGTSMATPMVAGLLGVMRALRPDLTPERAYAILRDTGRAGPDGTATGPTVDADGAIAAVVE